MKTFFIDFQLIAFLDFKFFVEKMKVVITAQHVQVRKDVAKNEKSM